MANEWSEKSLSVFLERHGVPVSEYGTGHAKTIHDLLGSIQKREVLLKKGGGPPRKFKKSMQGMPLLYCAKVKLDIYSDADPDGRLRYLVEGNQNLNGNLRTRSWRRSLSEKVGPDESPEAAAERGMHEELGMTFTPVTRPDVYLYEEYEAAPCLSKSFPGLLVAGPRFRLVTQLHPSLYDPHGYDEYRDGELRTHFGWKLASDVWEMR